MFYFFSAIFYKSLDVALISCWLLLEQDWWEWFSSYDEGCWGSLGSTEKGELCIAWCGILSWHQNSHLLLFGYSCKIILSDHVHSDGSCLSLPLPSIITLLQIICSFGWKAAIVVTFCSFCDSACSKSLHLSYLESLLRKPIDSGVSLHFFVFETKMSILYVHNSGT